MKNHLFVLAFCLSTVAATAQVGISTAAPSTTLDVNGALTTRETSVAVSGTAANLGTTHSFGQYRITGGTAAFTITPPNKGFDAATNLVSGARLVVANGTNFTGTLGAFAVPAGQAMELLHYI